MYEEQAWDYWYGYCYEAYTVAEIECVTYEEDYEEME